MTEPDNLVVEHLGHADSMRDDVREIKHCVGNFENRYAAMPNRLDRMDFRIERIERRLDLTVA